MYRIPIQVRLENFEGPLDLLLHLTQSHELDISKISIAKITHQYLAYVHLMQELSFDIASEFLVMAATLLHWKSRALLPQDEQNHLQENLENPEELTQDALVRQLLEHQRFRQAGKDLTQLPLLGVDVFSRSNDSPPIEKVWREMDLTDLCLSYQDILIRSRKRTQILKKETVSITDKIIEFGQRLEVGKLMEMKALLSVVPSAAETVITFLASLELARLRKLRLYQQGTYEAIYLELVETLKQFDFNLASGFHPLQTQNNTAVLPPTVVSHYPQEGVL